MKRYSNFDYLRLVLAFEVVASHAYAFLNIQHSFWGIDPVPAFVCLSGYLIPGSFARSADWQEFAWKRVLRVYPAFVASILLVVALFGFGATWPTMVCYLTAGLAPLFGCMNVALWSLMLEEVLYASHVVSRLRKLWNPWTIWACFGVCLVAAVALNTPSLNGIDRIFRAATSYFVGNLIYINREKVKGPWIATIGLVACVLIGKAIGPSFPLLSPVASACAIVAAWKLPQLPKLKTDLSYGAYIYHAPILFFVMKWEYAFWWTLGLTLVVSLVSAKFIEEPANQLKSRLSDRKTREPLQSVEVAA